MVLEMAAAAMGMETTIFFTPGLFSPVKERRSLTVRDGTLVVGAHAPRG
jgi:peroxiredoxin family protein